MYVLKNNLLYKFPDFRNFFIARVISLIGDSFSTIAVIWWIVSKGTEDSKLELGLMMATIVLPKALLGPYFGVLADRISRKKCLLFADAARAVLAVVLVLLLQLGMMTVPLMFLLCFLIAVFAPLFEAAEGAALMNITSEEYVGRATAMHSTAFNLSNLFGYFLGASVVAMVGVTAAFWFNAASFVLSYIFVLMIKNPLPAPQTEHKSSAWVGFKQGMSYVYSRKPIFWFVIFAAALNFVAAPFLMIIPLLVKFVFQETVMWVAILQGAFSVGSLVTGIFLAHYVWKRNLHFTMMIALAISSLLIAVLGLAGSKLFAVVLLVMIGVGIQLVNTLLMSQLQLVVSDEYKGRFFALIGALGLATLPAGFAISGFLSGVMSVQSLLIMVGLAMFVMSLSMLVMPTLNKLGEQLND
ncbi:MAG: MFS transporter [Negativicutes bacterium]